MPKIKHVWFDFSDTIVTPDPERHAKLRYATFAKLKSAPQTPELEKEYDNLRQRYGSHSNVFVQTFGLDGSFWPGEIAKIATDEGYYKLIDEAAPYILSRLAKIVPVSIFSNVDTESVMQRLGIDTSIFTNIFSSSSLRYPKPHPEGYLKIIELSHLPADQILYIGDLEAKDILPAKSVGLKTGIIWNKSDQADYNFNNFREILDLFKNGN
jgi:HAD superfamily hydrolase (TIGR01549 family)